MVFSESKAAALAAHILRMAGGKMEYLKLLKLMYLCERESLKAISTSITGDNFVSMKHGPVMSGTYDLIKGNWEWFEHDTWEKSIHRDKYIVSVVSDIDVSVYLSPFEIEIATDIWNRFKSVDKWEIVKWMHDTFPEWRETNSRIAINLEDIYKAVGVSDEDVARRLHFIQGLSAFERLLADAKDVS
ncbi:MAG: SocA family protein [Armatimonadetes bacterium]|nr:SocA family protein [Armatimonadota bacterium]